MQGAAGPGGAGDGSAADQHLAVRTQLHFAPGQRLADGTLRHVEGVVEGDERGGFGHSIALDNHKADGVPELFKRTGERAAA